MKKFMKFAMILKITMMGFPVEVVYFMCDVYKAHMFSKHNKSALLDDTLCGCFFCLSIFSPLIIIEWEDGGTTAVCPFCNTDAIIGADSGFPISTEFLQLMRNYWF